MGLIHLSSDQLDSIHFAASHILKDVGIYIAYEEAADLFYSAGAKVERNGDKVRAYIPEQLLVEALASAPKTVTYHARDPKHDLSLEKNKVTFATFGEQVKVNDLITRENRNSVKDDCENAYRLVDALDGLGICQRALCPGDKNPSAQAAHNFHAAMTNTGKHMTIGMVDKANIEAIRQMAVAISGGEDEHLRRPLATCSCCSVSPLTLARQGSETMIASSRAGFNVDIMTMVLAGGTGPATLAGTLAQTMAELLSGVILAQLSRKGTAVTLGCCSTIINMSNGLCSVGAPEWGMIGSAIAQMGRYYGLPTRIGGGVSDSKLPDFQAAYEFTINSLCLALAGTNIIFGAGGLETGLTLDFAKLVLDHECIGNIQRMLRGVNLSDEELALDLQEKMGPGASYMTTRHTLAHCRSFSKGDLFNRETIGTWSKRQDRTLVDDAYDRARSLLESHKPAPLSEKVLNSMNEIVADLEERVAK
jgi:trimethylamine--corrinoid protein Co-methyltransferase